uniref:Uncharacterized protein n=1 Tax=viral metagenome TaxID=1070528 RepID=A0A6M3LA34_9ZZZZ
MINELIVMVCLSANPAENPPTILDVIVKPIEITAIFVSDIILTTIEKKPVRSFIKEVLEEKPLRNTLKEIFKPTNEVKPK